MDELQAQIDKIVNDFNNFKQTFLNHRHLGVGVDESKTLTPDTTTTTTTAGYVHGGDGSDGPLDTTGGNVTIDLAGAAIFIKNYSSITMTQNSVGFINPHAGGTTIIFLCSGDAVVTSAAAHPIDLRFLGGTNGSGGNTDTDGTDGDTSFPSLIDGVVHAGKKGLSGTHTGTNAAAPTAWGYVYKGRLIVPGLGGGGGGGGQSSSGGTGGSGGDGGRGAASFVMEVAGNFTGSGVVIDASGYMGSPGQNGTNFGNLNHDYAGSGGGGGGGSAGAVLISVAGTITYSGSIIITGGVGGAEGVTPTGVNGGSVHGNGAPGGGASGASSPSSAGTAASAGTGNQAGGKGGKGADGFVEIIQYV